MGKKVVLSGLIAGCVLLILSILGLYVTIWLFPSIALQYFDPTFDRQSERAVLYFLHPFIAGPALAWFWDRGKGLFKGSFLARGVEFGFLYWLVAILPMMWLIYSAIDVSLSLVGSWLLFGFMQGVVAGLVCQKINA